MEGRSTTVFAPPSSYICISELIQLATISSQFACTDAIQPLEGLNVHYATTSYQRVLHSGNCGFHSNKTCAALHIICPQSIPTSTKCTAHPHA